MWDNFGLPSSSYCYIEKSTILKLHTTYAFEWDFWTFCITISNHGFYNWNSSHFGHTTLLTLVKVDQPFMGHKLDWIHNDWNDQTCVTFDVVGLFFKKYMHFSV